MKKISLYTTLFLAACLMACTEDFNEEVAAPQSYPEESAQTMNGFAIALDGGFTSPVVLGNWEEHAAIQAVKVTATPEMAEGASITFRLQISDTENFTKIRELPSHSENNAAIVNAADLNQAVKELFGRAPNPRTIHLRAYIYILDGNSTSQIPDPLLLGTLTVTPVAPEVIIEQAYYLIGDINEWNWANIEAHKFAHSDKDVYDDPVFTILTEFGANSNFKIAPQSAKDAENWDFVWGNTDSDGFTGTEGNLATGGGSMKIAGTGWARITLNMMELTYTVEVIGEMKLQLYVPGDHQGWGFLTVPILYNRNFDMKYDGYVYLESEKEFKFTSEPNWDGTNYGNGGADGLLSTAGDALNLTVPETGFYRLWVDLSGIPAYTATKTEWGIIGDATAGGWDNSTPMTLNTATGEWTVTTPLLGGKVYKFRANDAWEINLGGSLSDLTYGGDNIPVSEEGTYTITLNLSDPRAYKATAVKQ
jgi:hypothetical protein